MLRARENLMEAIQAFLKKYDQIPPKEKSMALLLAEERFFKIKQALEEEQNQPKNIQELLLKLINDLQILNGIQLKQEEYVAKVSSQYWKPPIFYDDDDDDDEESSIPLRDIISELLLELAYINLIPPGIDEADFDPEEDICLTEKLLYDKSSSRPLKELNYEIFDAIIESFSPSPILVEDSDYLMEEIDIFLAPDDSIPSGIENDDYDSEGDNIFLEELLNNDSLPKNESFHFDRYYVPSSPHPPEKPPDDDGIYFDIEPNIRVLTAKVFNHGILASKNKKSPHFLSHRGLKAF
nr:hypothetical protein [Tanacetum cinerariifolium]